MMKRKIALCLFLALAALSLAAAELRLTVLYDNYAASDAVQPDWGFACLVQGAGKTVLFDSGARAEVLRKNAESLKVDPGGIDLIVISHLHGDHAGGLEWVLSQKRDVPVYLPAMAPDEYMAKVRQWGGQPQRVSESLEICPRVHSTGEMPADFDPAFTEQSLVLRTADGLLVITGCAHPGIAAIVRRAPQVAPGTPRTVLGGFHLMGKSDEEIAAIIQQLKAAGVERCGASHCTGDRAIELFRGSFAGRFLKLGVGATFTFPW